MKIHPHDFILEDLGEVLWEDSSSLGEHLKQCSVCQGRFWNLAVRRSEPVAGAKTQFLQWPRATPEREPGKPSDRDPVSKLANSAPKARLQTWRRLERLINRSLAQEGRNPALEEELARRALELARYLNERSDAEEVQDLRALAWASIGNARQQRFDLDAADEAMEKAFAHLRSAREPKTRVRLLRRLASLRKAQQRFEDSLRLLKQAQETLSEDDEEVQNIVLLVKIANVHEEAGHPENAIPLLDEALGRIDDQGSPRLLLAARHNLVTCLCGLGRFEEARRSFDESTPLYEKFPDPWVQDRRAWIEARIVRGLGVPTRAEALFLKAKEGFLADGRPREVAFVSLDLASLYAEQKRIQDLTRVALEIFPVFSSRRVDRAARATLALLEPLA